MSGNTTGFQKTFVFRANGEYDTIGMYQAVTYGTGEKEVIVPDADNAIPVGVVTYQHEHRDGAHVAVQLDRISEVKAAEAIAYGEAVIIGAGGTVKKAAGVTDANILGVAQSTAQAGEMVQVLIMPQLGGN